MDGKTEEVMAYVMKPGRPLGTPGCYYYSLILEGCRAAGFDTEMLKVAVLESAQEGEAHESDR